MNKEFFKAEKNHKGDNWLIANFGEDRDGGNWSVTTNGIHGSELHNVSFGAKGDAELVAKLLNDYWAKNQRSNLTNNK